MCDSVGTARPPGSNVDVGGMGGRCGLGGGGHKDATLDVCLQSNKA